VVDRAVSYEDLESAFDADDEHARLLELASESPDREALVAELARTAHVELRAWVAHALPDLVERGAVTVDVASSALLQIARRDSDVDIRDEAVRSLLAVDPEAARDLVPLLRRRLNSRDYFSPVTAMWTLATLGESSARAAIQEYGRRV